MNKVLFPPHPASSALQWLLTELLRGSQSLQTYFHSPFLIKLLPFKGDRKCSCIERAVLPFRGSLLSPTILHLWISARADHQGIRHSAFPTVLCAPLVSDILFSLPTSCPVSVISFPASKFALPRDWTLHCVHVTMPTAGYDSYYQLPWLHSWILDVIHWNNSSYHWLI